MHILAVHNLYQIRGGEDECYEAEIKLLKDAGHEVDAYEETNDRVASLSKAQMAIKTVWSQDAYQAVKQRLAQQTYDVMHVQNFFPLISPSVYYAAREQGVPVVQTLHNYRLLCPNALFFRNGSVCEDCLGKAVPYPGVLHGCYRENRLASAGVTAMLAFHRAKQTWTETVDRYITLTEFARQKFIEGGLPAHKIFVKPNFVDPDPGVGEGQGGYALYVGRLSVEKGLDTLLAAWAQLEHPLPLKIVGDGPLADQVVEATQRMPHVTWLGRKPMTEVHALMGNAMCLVFPSKWYETFGRVAIEAFAKGTPVVASDIGAIAELVESGRTGLLFEPASPQALAAKVEWLLANPAKLAHMRQNARAEFEAKYTATKNYHQLMAIYASADTNLPDTNLMLTQ
ncbi:glycosyltransferase family 4 protein [Stenomitos frigidus]|uniref:Glycosyl transferase family 1 n=1 Tax=Stenomitos frigidus ULC18 TaxID=2107698 RepID=A0A2T1DYL6_9CYAN|nr:glycosyltransferase family 4 protein [Stenomitos frigidus]PSB25596.1 glycosyl transferase family 1 [Stenomitos frigidus ULC18]